MQDCDPPLASSLPFGDTTTFVNDSTVHRPELMDDRGGWTCGWLRHRRGEKRGDGLRIKAEPVAFSYTGPR